MADSMTRTITTDEANRRLGQHLLDVVGEQDARIPAERRTPCTVAGMCARLTALDDVEQDACGLCGRWTLCGPCGGSQQRAAAVLAGAGVTA